MIYLFFSQCNVICREGTWTWSNSYNVDVDPSMYSEIWTPNTDVGNADDCVVMTVGNNSRVDWKDIPCLDVEFNSKPIQVIISSGHGDDLKIFIVNDVDGD